MPTEAELAEIRARRFEGASAFVFNRVWCEVAAICGVDPRHMHEDQHISKICEDHGKTGLNLPIMELEALVMRETEGLPPPNGALATVGEVVAYILAGSCKVKRPMVNQ